MSGIESFFTCGVIVALCGIAGALCAVAASLGSIAISIGKLNSGRESSDDESAMIEKSHNNYLTHSWECQEGHLTSYCSECGCENQGDPREFEWLDYPDCKVRDMR